MSLVTKIFLSIIFVIIASSYLSAQEESITIRGFITDETNAPLAYVNVFILDSFDGAMSDDNGKFSFTTIKQERLNWLPV